MVLQVQAPAKLNRFLAVLGRRPDGFHDLELVTTVLEGVTELTDTLEGEPAAELSLTISGPTGAGLVADEANLVLRAWRLLVTKFGSPAPGPAPARMRVPPSAEQWRRIQSGAASVVVFGPAMGLLRLFKGLAGFREGLAILLQRVFQRLADTPHGRLDAGGRWDRRWWGAELRSVNVVRCTQRWTVFVPTW